MSFFTVTLAGVLEKIDFKRWLNKFEGVGDDHIQVHAVF